MASTHDEAAAWRVVLLQRQHGSPSACSEHRRSHREDIAWREITSVVLTEARHAQSPTIRIKPDSETAAQFERASNITGPAENAIVSMSRIFVVA